MNNSDEKDQLTRELQDRSRDIDGHPIDFESVKQGARRIARRRRITGVAVAAAVLAIAVPTALALTNGTTGGLTPSARTRRRPTRSRRRRARTAQYD